MEAKHNDYYRKLRSKVSSYLESNEGAKNPWAEILLAGPDLFYLLCKLIADPRVPKIQKAKLVGAVAYFISPIDLLPEAILGPIGYLDDIAFAAYALHSVINAIEPGIAQEHWTGKEDVLVTTQKILTQANRFLGGGVWGRLTKIMKRKKI